MRFTTYLSNSLKIAVKTSKIHEFRDIVFTKYHKKSNHDEKNYTNDLEVNEKSLKNNITKFHKDTSFRNHILDLATDLTTEEQDVLSEISAEVEFQDTTDNTEENTFNNIEALTLVAEEKDSCIHTLKEESITIKIIVVKGIIVERVYKSSTGKVYSILY